MRPTPPSDDSPSTACQSSTVCAPGGVQLGHAPPGFGSPPGIVPSRRIPPPPPPPAPMQQGAATSNAVTYPREWTPLHTKPKASGGGGPPDGPGGGAGSGAGDQTNPSGNAHPRKGGAGPNSSRGGHPVRSPDQLYRVSKHKTGAFRWLLTGFLWAESNKSNWHNM